MPMLAKVGTEDDEKAIRRKEDHTNEQDHRHRRNDAYRGEVMGYIEALVDVGREHAAK